MELDAQSLFVKFKTQIESLEQLKRDFSDVHTHMEDTVKGFHKRVREEARKTMEMNKTMVEDQKGAASGMKDTLNEMGNALGINFGKIATAAGITLSVVSALDNFRKSMHAQTQMETLLTGAGGGLANASEANQLGAFSYAVGRPTLLGGTGIGREEAFKVAGTLLSTPGMAGSDILGRGGMAEQAMFLGRSTGVGSEQTAQIFSDMVRKLDVSANMVVQSFTELFEKGKSVGNVNGQYIQTVMNLTTALRSYNIDLDTTAGITKRFWHEIEQGRISVEDLAKTFTVARSSTEGQRAFLGTQVLGMGGDPITAMMRTEAVLGGEGPGGEGAQGKAMRSIFQEARRMAEQVGGSDEQKRFLQEKFLQAISGLNFQNLSQLERGKIFKAFETGEVGPGAQAALGMAGKTSEQNLFEIGQTLAKIEQGPLKMIADLMSVLVILVGKGILYLPSLALPGSLRKDIESYVNYMVPGADAMQRADMQGQNYESIPRVGAYSSLNRMLKDSPSMGQFQNRLEGVLESKMVRDDVKKAIIDALGEGKLKVTNDLTIKGDLKISGDGRIVTMDILDAVIHGKEVGQGSGTMPSTPVAQR